MTKAPRTRCPGRGTAGFWDGSVGASANVVMLGIARRADNPISFWEFTRKGAVVTAMSIALAAIYLWLRYFVLG